jgi:hypothetical protein
VRTKAGNLIHMDHLRRSRRGPKKPWIKRLRKTYHHVSIKQLLDVQS